MKKRSKLILILFLALIIILPAGIFLAGKMFMSFPDKTAYWPETDSCRRVLTDDGLYYFKHDRNILYFYDSATQTESIVCKKPGCQHKDENCDAYVGGDVPAVLLNYNDKLYILESTLSVESNDDDEYYQSGEVNLIEMNTDGTERRIIYKGYSGSPLSIWAKDNALYFTIHKLKDEKAAIDMDNRKKEYILFQYDLRWRKLSEIKSFIPEESCFWTDLRVHDIGQDYGLVSAKYKDAEGKYHLQLYKLTSGELSEIGKIDSEELSDRRYFSIREDVYNIFSDIYGERYLSRIEPDLLSEQKLISIGNEGRISNLGNGYLQIIMTDYKKAVYDIRSGKLYIANNCFTEEGKYIPDLVDVNPEKDMLFIDQHDYTGMKPGTVFTESQSSYASVSLSEFLRENYFVYDELTEEEKKKLDWMTIY